MSHYMSIVSDKVFNETTKELETIFGRDVTDEEVYAYLEQQEDHIVRGEN